MKIHGCEASRYITFNYVAVDIEKLVYSSIPVVSNIANGLFAFLHKNTSKEHS